MKKKIIVLLFSMGTFSLFAECDILQELQVRLNLITWSATDSINILMTDASEKSVTTCKALIGLVRCMYKKVIATPDVSLAEILPPVEPRLPDISEQMPSAQIHLPNIVTSATSSAVVNGNSIDAGYNDDCQSNIASCSAWFNKGYSLAVSMYDAMGNALVSVYNGTFVPAYSKVILPVASKTKCIAQEIASAGADITTGAGYCVKATAQFVTDHPEVTTTLIALAVARAAYVFYARPAFIVKECRKIDLYITDPAGALRRISIEEITALRDSLLWHTGIFYRVKLGSWLARTLYHQEVKAIDTFINDLLRVKLLGVVHFHDFQNIIDSASQVKTLLTKRLPLSDNQLV